MRDVQPFLSVIVPAHQAAEQLPRSLAALRASEIEPDAWELIVVDDASTDDTSLVAAAFADVLVRLPGVPHGPAYARNRGFEASRGDVIVFVDADVCIHPDALRRFRDMLASESDLCAVFGSYDASPPAPGIVSRYRNLLHHYVHHQCAGNAETFWAGLGAIRRTTFRDAGMFDEWHYARPQIEDIELGRRIRQLGCRILLVPGIQGSHLKAWTLRDVLANDFKNRGVPWMRLILQERAPAGRRTLNLRMIEKWCTLLAWAAAATATGALVAGRGQLAATAALAALAGVVGLNWRFYHLLQRRASTKVALGAIPLHLLYYLSNGLAVVAGWLAHTLVGEPQPPVEASALAQIGVATWPPPVSRPARNTWAARARPGARQRTER